MPQLEQLDERTPDQQSAKQPAMHEFRYHDDAAIHIREIRLLWNVRKSKKYK